MHCVRVLMVLKCQGSSVLITGITWFERRYVIFYIFYAKQSLKTGYFRQAVIAGPEVSSVHPSLPTEFPLRVCDQNSPHLKQAYIVCSIELSAVLDKVHYTEIRNKNNGEKMMGKTGADGGDMRVIKNMCRQ